MAGQAQEPSGGVRPSSDARQSRERVPEGKGFYAPVTPVRGTTSAPRKVTKRTSSSRRATA